MKVANLFGALVLTSATLFSNQASAGLFAPTITPLGNLNSAPSVEANLIHFQSIISPDYYTFSLSTESDVSVDFSSLLNLNLGAKFSLWNSTGTTKLQEFNMPTLVVFGGPELTFSDIAAGSYQFRYTSSLVNIGGLSRVTFTATPVPEPETNALMLLGLGMIGFIARRKLV
ncbi:FxDxF family PEP-CTERM protein [Methylophilus methylotrophus]|uniref:FxDxF family PEP-CTERM protein n=1 Tax=Methylophilus methylotrophus TaxID=17 RepID=UPI000F5AAA68|nr:FxDxF family PEP-CTERM protein [Methylophilus methylotrophus]